MSKFIRNGVPRHDDGRVNYKPQKHHGYTGVIIILGFFLPPLAVLARFGVGKDFFINIVCTICGYFPGHGHNFFIQNIRNNDNHPNRTPKWAKRYGLVDDSFDRRRKKKRAWTGRYNDQLPERRLYDDDGNPTTYDMDHRFEDGDGGAARRRAAVQRAPEGFEEQYYNADPAPERNAWAGDAYDQQRNGSAASLGGPLPGAGEAERRKAKSKSNMRAAFGRKKDRHAQSQHVMGDGDAYDHRAANGYADPDADLGGRRRSLDSDDEGPEEAGRNYAIGYSVGGASGATERDTFGDEWRAPAPSSKRQPEAPRHESRQPAVDIMDQRHEF